MNMTDIPCGHVDVTKLSPMILALTGMTAAVILPSPPDTDSPVFDDALL